jgi:hypothetical protein
MAGAMANEVVIYLRMPMTEATRAVIEAERARQVLLGWTPDHDDRQDLIHLGDVIRMQQHGLDWLLSQRDPRSGDVRIKVAKLAAVCVAFLESQARRTAGVVERRGEDHG